MHRQIIFDFLCNHRELLNKYQYSHMSICLLGRLAINDISNLLLTNDEVIVFHVKEPRIYEKAYPFSTLEKTIADMVMYTKKGVYLEKSDFKEELLDPFYQKDIRKQDFYSLWLLPIMDEDNIVGVILVYFNQEAKAFSLSNKDMLKLYNLLQNAEGNAIERLIDESINKKEEYIKIVYKKDLKTCYFDDLIKNKLRWKKNIVDISWNKKIALKLEREIKTRGYQRIELEDIIVYYLSKHDYQSSVLEKESLAIETINNHGLETFSLIVAEKNNLDDFIYNLFPSNIIKKYYKSNTFCVYLIDTIITNIDYKEITSNLMNIYHLVITSNQISNKMNLYSLTNYLYEIKPVNYNLEMYSEYLKNLNEMRLNGDIMTNNICKIKEFVNSNSKKFYGYLPILVDAKLFTKECEETFSTVSNQLLTDLIKESKTGYILPIIPPMLNNKKIFFDLEKMYKIDPNFKVLLTNPNPNILLSEVDILEKNIKKIRELGIPVLLHGSVYYNFRSTHLIEQSDALYIANEDFESLIKHPAGINSAIYDYIVRSFKELVIDFPLSDVTYEYISGLINYRK